MKMDYRMKQFATVMAFATGGGTCDVALFVDKGEHLLIVIVVHCA
jgi:hypothetical protein